MDVDKVFAPGQCTHHKQVLAFDLNEFEVYLDLENANFSWDCVYVPCVYVCHVCWHVCKNTGSDLLP